MKIKIILLLFAISCSSIYAQGFKFAVMSDSRGSINGVNEPVLSALVNHLAENQKDVKFLVFTGDMVTGNSRDPEKTKSQLFFWKKVMAPIYENENMIWPRVWPVIGNHEVQHREDVDNYKEVFQDVFMNGPEEEKGLTYSFDYGNSHFVMLCTDRWNEGDPEDPGDGWADYHYIKDLDWLEKDLMSASERGYKHIFTFAHEMPYPVGGHLLDGLPNLRWDLTLPLNEERQWYMDSRNRFLSLLNEYNADAHICGHEHLYSRQSVDGVYQIIAGCAGAPLYAFNPLYGQTESDVFELELTYDEAKIYYDVLNYNHGPGKNSQASEDFVGMQIFHYCVLDVRDDYVKVETYGAYPAKGSAREMGSEIKLMDEFVINKN